ncbi:MAG: GNAT family N-acetyltransferase, partial [Actinobacteria bacterium]|nr:GNAT family N-acetyltransferase [Actinomycetota bacterium]NIU65407.1 GNAT family N-acetyltransferase [Actinomycetota bacterium]NIW27207.1 GNAT family N-acetyltransferase [Actinomycetota bacterium]
DAEDVRKLLAEASPETSTWPDDDRARRWAGIRNTGGTLVACLADTSRHPSVAHMSSVATAPYERRRGYARTLVAWVTRQFLAEGATMVTLGMYADNDAARRLYTGLGFNVGQRFTTADVNTSRPVLSR